MLVLIPYPLTEQPFSLDADSLRMVSKLICHQIYQCNLERSGLAAQLKRTGEAPPTNLNRKPVKAEVFGPYRNVSQHLWKKWCGWSYAKTRERLVQKRIIEPNHIYSNGRFAKSYRIAEAFWQAPLVLKHIPTHSVKYSECSAIDSNVSGTTSPYKSEYLCAESHLKGFKLPDWNAEAFNRICDANDQDPKKWGDLKRFSIIAMNENQWWSKVDRNYRHHTPLTTVPSQIRKHMVHGLWENVDGWDFKNFQPSLLQFYGETGLSKPIPQDEHTHFFQLCKEGNIYEFFAEKMGKRSRDDVKKPMLAMLNIENERMVEMPIYRCLSQWFPVIGTIIYAIKKDDHKNMATFLQRKEAEIVFGHVVRRFALHSKPFFTVHDSVITTKTYTGLLGEVFEKVIEEIGMNTRKGRA